MNKITCLFALMMAVSPFANSAGLPPGTSDYILEASTLVIEGQAAEDLYNSLNARVVADSLNTNWSANYRKKNKFADCRIIQSRYVSDEDGSVWVTESAECQLKAPRGSVDNGTSGT